MRENENSKIIGTKCILVPYNSEHVPNYHRWMEDEELRNCTASERLTLEQEYDMQKSWREDEDKCTFIVLSRQLYDETNDELSSMIGDVNIFFTPEGSELEVMIADSRFRGHGIGKEAIGLMIRYADEVLKRRDFYVKISASNERSLEMFKKLHFVVTKFVEVFSEYTLSFDYSNMDVIRNFVDFNLQRYK